MSWVEGQSELKKKGRRRLEIRGGYERESRLKGDQKKTHHG
jgi:hypothetical protein